VTTVCDSHSGPIADHAPSEDARSSRREVIAAAAGLLGAAVIGTGAARAVGTTQDAPRVLPLQVAPDLFVLPRDSWGADLPPRGDIAAEAVQFLLVHHTASSNRYPVGGSVEVLRQTYAFHTSSSKGWADVCYEFFVDHDGVVYEGRSGALAGPVSADATGGSQGFAQLVCLIGDFSVAEPTAAMTTSLTKVLAWLAERYGIDTRPGATTTFVSRGSQRYPAGETVTTSTIAGHRDMSYTACPGDTVYFGLDQLRIQVHAQRAAWKGATWQAQRLGLRSP
jgi:hypothetical protein